MCLLIENIGRKRTQQQPEFKSIFETK